jgi:anti-sigma factor RsiW
VNCEQYVTGYLSAQADGELTGEEEHAVEGHLGAGAEDGCAVCRVRLAEENLLKALIRRQAPTVNAPQELKARIREALDRVDAEAPAQPTAADSTLMRQLRRPRVWLPLAAASAIILALFVGSLPGVRGVASEPGRTSSMAPSAAFDQAVEARVKFERPGGFHTNVPSASLVQIATAYGALNLPNEMWNFERSGYSAVGGRLDNLPDGGPVTYTLYHGANGDILDMRYRGSNFTAPAGVAAAERDGHRFYRYRGYSLCLTMSEPGRYVDVLAARAPIAELERAVSTASLSHLVK